VSAGNHTVNFTGYNEDNNWVLTRSIDSKNMTYSLEEFDDGRLAFWFSSANSKKYIDCEIDTAINCTGSIMVNGWNATVATNTRSITVALASVNTTNITIVEELSLEYPTVNLTIMDNNTRIWNKTVTLRDLDSSLMKAANGSERYTDE